MTKKQIGEISAEEVMEQYQNLDPEQTGQDEGDDLIQIDEEEA